MSLSGGKISVIIVSFIRADLLKQCVKSIYSQDYSNFEIIIVDNGQQVSVDALKNGSFAPIVLHNEENNFYAQAQNQGIKSSEGEYILCLNDDITLEKDFISKALEGFKKDSKIGAVSGKVVSFYDKKIIDSTGLFLGRSRKPVDRGYRSKDNRQFDKDGYIFGVPGAVGIYKREMLEDITVEGDYFDPQYKMFYEDLDLCWRAQNKGWKAYYVPQAIAYHARGASAQSVIADNIFSNYSFANLSSELQLMLLRNRYATIIKNDTAKDFLKNILFFLAYELKLWGYILLFKPNLIFKFAKDFHWLKNSIKKRRIIKRVDFSR